MTAKIGDVGTLRELDVKPGDRVYSIEGMTYHDVIEAEVIKDSLYYGEVRAYLSDYGWGVFDDEKYRLVSRAVQATPQPTIWRDLSPEEKGALLLAAHEGKVIEVWDDVGHEWLTCRYPNWTHGCAYRLPKEPVRETEKFDVFYNKGFGVEACAGTGWTATHRITFDTIDGVPDCNSVKMEVI